jgi:hypothetical protein
MAEASSSSATIHTHAPVRRKISYSPMATLACSCECVHLAAPEAKVPQAASSLAVPPEPPAERKQSSERRDRLVHGSAGRAHQLATLPSS